VVFSNPPPPEFSFSAIIADKMSCIFSDYARGK